MGFHSKGMPPKLTSELSHVMSVLTMIEYTCFVHGVGNAEMFIIGENQPFALGTQKSMCVWCNAGCHCNWKFLVLTATLMGPME